MRPFDFAIERADEGDIAVVVVHGEIDLVTAPRVGGAVAAANAASGVVLDLSDVDFLDSTGLRELLVAQRELGGRLTIVCHPGGAAHRLMTVAGLNEALPLYERRSAALDAVCGAR